MNLLPPTHTFLDIAWRRSSFWGLAAAKVTATTKTTMGGGDG
jgi:hypothetical protein